MKLGVGVLGGLQTPATQHLGASQAGRGQTGSEEPNRFLPEGELRDVDPALFTGRFCAAGEVDRVSEEAISRHPLADHPRHHLPGVDPNGDLEGRNNPHVTARLRDPQKHT